MAEYCKNCKDMADEIERLKSLYYCFQLTGNESMLQLEFQCRNRELEIEFSPQLEITYLKIEGDAMTEGKVMHASHLLWLLEWLKGGE